MSAIHHALVLNLHQPPNNLDDLLAEQEWEVKEILFALDRMPRACWGYEDLARVHLSMSGSLLETLGSPDFQEKLYGTVKVGDMLWHLQNEAIFNILGTAYYHPVLPLTPEADWDAQIERWQGIARHLFWREQFDGFWPPEMGFCMEMIPHLVKHGYRYVLVDDIYIESLEGEMSWQELRYRPHVAEYRGEEIIVVVRDRELSNAQLSGMNPGWFIHEVEERTKWCDFEPLVTTCSDGDNGGWFRNHNNLANFWYVFYQALLDKVRAQETRVKPTFIHDYLDGHAAHGRVKVHTGAWNTEDHYGDDFIQWTGTPEQKAAHARIQAVSAAFHAMQGKVDDLPDGRLATEAERHISDAHWRLLRAETSCNFYWAEAWVPKVHDDLKACEDHLDEAECVIAGKGY
ncbi:MAG: glycoside hydrolase family 57 [Opitutales bacterium]